MKRAAIRLSKASRDKGRRDAIPCSTIVLLIAFFGGERRSPGADVPSGAPVRYCGVHCVYGAIKALGLSGETTLEELLVPKYVGTPTGSSLAELKAAVEDLGGYAEAMTGLSSAVLVESAYPLILNVASEGQLRAYNHWILFLGMEDGKAKVMDPPGPCRLVPVADVLRRWNGTALVVSNRAVESSRVTRAEYERLAIWATIVLGIVILGGCCRWLAPLAYPRRTIGPKHRLLRKTLLEAALLIGVSTAVALLVHASADEGFLKNTAAVEQVARAHLDTFFTKLDLARMRSAVDGKAVIIDARLRRDFDAGHIPRAISMPVDSKDHERLELLQGVSKSDPIVIYCQSKDCSFDDRIGIWLSMEGYTDVSVYPGGWNEWLEHEKQ